MGREGLSTSLGKVYIHNRSQLVHVRTVHVKIYFINKIKHG